MSTSIAIATSGLQAAQSRMDAAASRIAAAGAAQPAQAVMPDTLAADLIDTRIAAYVFKANLKVLQTEANRVGTLLDVHA